MRRKFIEFPPQCIADAKRLHEQTTTPTGSTRWSGQ